MTSFDSEATKNLPGSVTVKGNNNNIAVADSTNVGAVSRKWMPADSDYVERAQFTIKTLKVLNYDEYIVGIATTSNLAGFGDSDQDYLYLITAKGKTIRVERDQETEGNKPWIIFKSGDILKYTINFVTKKILLSINGGSESTIFNNIAVKNGISYRLWIGFQRESESAMIMDYNEIKRSDEKKQIEELEQKNSFYATKERKLQQTIADLLKKQKDLESENKRLKFKSFVPSLLTPYTEMSLSLQTADDEKNYDHGGNNSIGTYLTDPNEGWWDILKKWWKGDITRYNFLQVIGVKLKTIGCEALGTSIGGAIGVLIGGIPGKIVGMAVGWLLGKLAGYVGEWMWERIFPSHKTKEQKMMKEALDMFSFKEKDIYNSSVFNEKALKKAFHDLAKQKHVDKGGSDEEFIELNNHYELLKELFPSKHVEPSAATYSAFNLFLSRNDGYLCMPTIRGLMSDKQYNGKYVNVNNYIEEKNKWRVKLLHQEKYLDVKPHNLALNMMFNL